MRPTISTSLSAALLVASTVLSVWGLSGCSAPEPPKLGVPRDLNALERGRSLVKGLASCGFCHGDSKRPSATLAGGQEFYDKYGPVHAANLTNSKSGLLAWTNEEIVRAVRSSIGRNDRLLSREMHTGYEWMSDNDLLSIIAYLRTLGPVERSVEKRDLSFIDRNTTGFLDSWSDVRGFVPEVPKRFELEYGKYLTDHVARCGSCHDSETGVFSEWVYLGGGKLIRREGGEKYAPGIKNSVIDGIGGWSETDLVSFLKTGMTPEAVRIDSEFCPIAYFSRGDESELVLIAKYIKSLE